MSKHSEWIIKSTYCFYAHMHEIMNLNRSKSACTIHWGCTGPGQQLRATARSTPERGGAGQMTVAETRAVEGWSRLS